MTALKHHSPEPPWLPPPDPPHHLTQRYASTPGQRGGTLIAEDVRDRATHARCLRTPDGYRPSRCPRCGHAHLHVHDYSDRVALGEPASAPVRVVRYQCVHPACLALWRVLPAFVARFLWYAWPVVETSALVPLATPAPPPPVPVASPPPSSPRPMPSRPVRVPSRVPSRRSVGRWRGRLDASARMLVQILAALTTPVITALLASLAHLIDATRTELVAAYARAMLVPPGHRLAALAGHLHRAVPGIRLM